MATKRKRGRKPKKEKKLVIAEDSEYSRLLAESIDLIEKVPEDNQNKVRITNKLKTIYSDYKDKSASSVNNMLAQLTILNSKVKRMANG